MAAASTGDGVVVVRTRTIAVVVVVAAAGGVGQGFGRFVFPVLLPAMKEDLLESYGDAGFIGTANVGAYLLGALVVMALSVRVRGTTLIKTGLACSATGMFVLATAQGLPQLALGMLLAGLGGAAIWVPAPGIVGASVGPTRRGAAVGLVNLGIGVGMVVGTFLARLARAWWGPDAWRWVWSIQGGLALLAFVAALVVLRLGGAGPVAPPRLTALRHVPGWLPYTGSYFLFGFGYIVTITYVVASLRDAGFGAAHAADVYALLGVGAILGGVLIGRLSDHLGRRQTMILGYALTAACPLLLLTQREPYAAIASIGFGLTFSGSVAVVAAYLADTARPGEFAPAFGAATVAFGAAQALGPQVGGVLVDRTGGFTVTFVVSAIALGAAALLAAAMPRQPRLDPVESAAPAVAVDRS
jgi:predicted MFS family arabinose efflux permease